MIRATARLQERLYNIHCTCNGSTILRDVRACTAIIISGHSKILILTSGYVSEFADSMKHSIVTKLQPLQLCTALNFEQPNLGLGVEYEPSFFRNWGSGYVSAGKISNKVMQQIMMDRIFSYENTSNFTRFNRNVLYALKVVLGGSDFYTTEALSISGYNIDFEVLFDADHRPIPIQHQWKFQSVDKVLHSVGLGHKTVLRAGVPVPEISINLASDWGQKFIVPSTPVSKKIALEADGPWHFASNCNHVLGSTVLKHRQLKALGWEVISVGNILLLFFVRPL